MPTADYSSYHQPPATGADGTKLDNFIDAVQTTVNALDKNNLAANAGILAAQLADPTTGKVLGSSGSACAAVYPPGYVFAYDELTASVTGITGTTVAAATSVKTSTSAAFDGATIVEIRFWCPSTTQTTGGFRTKFELFEDTTDIGEIGQAVAASNLQTGIFVGFRRRTPAAGAHTYTVKAFAPDGGTSVVTAGAGGVTTVVPAFIEIVKKG